MAKAQVQAGQHPSEFDPAKAQEMRTLKGKGNARTPQDRDRLLDLLVERVEALEARDRLRGQ